MNNLSNDIIEPPLAYILISLGSPRFTTTNCASIFQRAAQQGLSTVTCILLDSLEFINANCLFNLSETEATDAVRERIIRVTSSLRSAGRRQAHIIQLSDLEDHLPHIIEKKKAICELYANDKSFARLAQNETYRCLHPMLKRVGVRNQRNPLVAKLSRYVLEELALKWALAELQQYSYEYAFTSELVPLEKYLREKLPDTVALHPPKMEVLSAKETGGVKVESLSFAYGDRDGFRLATCSFEGVRGEVVGVLGKSASGKTTILRLIAGHLTPAKGKGKVLIGGEDVTHAAAAERDVVTVFQDFALFPHLTVKKNIAFGLEASKSWRSSEIDELSDILMRRFNLDTCADKLPSELSGGQRQRTALARALAVAPAILLLDEPTASLDFEARDELVEVIYRVVSLPPAPTVLVVSHDRDFVLDIASRLIVIDKGQIIQFGDSLALMENPDPQIAQLVGGFVVLRTGTEKVVVREADLILRRDDDQEGSCMSSDTTPQSNYCHGTVSVVTAGRRKRITLKCDGDAIQFHSPPAQILDDVEPGMAVRLEIKSAGGEPKP